MTKFKTNLWTFLSKKTYINFNLLERLNMAINLAEEVQKMSGTMMGRTAHKDLKPSNIMFDPSCNLRLIDFGIGRTYGGYTSFELSSGGSSGTIRGRQKNPNPNPNPSLRKNESQSQSQSHI